MNFNYEELKSPFGVNVKRNNVIKNFPNEYQKILQYSKDFQLSHLPFTQQVWIFLHDTKGIPKCKASNCENLMNFESFNYGHKTYCSMKCAAKCPEFIAKIEKTNMEKYGNKTYMASKEGRSKVKGVMLEKYGVENIMYVEGTTEKIKQTTLKNHGVENAMYLKKFQTQAMETHLKNNGEFKLNNKEVRIKRNKLFDDAFLSKYEDYNFITSIGQTLEVECKKCKSNYKIYRGTFRARILENVEVCTICNPINLHDSFIERQLIFFIESLDIPFLKNDRTVIKPKEIDVYIPSKKLAIELNGLIWHSNYYVEDTYHVDKTNNCLKKDIQLLHVYENEWNKNQEIVKSIIKHKLGLSTCKIYARKCKLIELSDEQSKDFLDKNHLFASEIKWDFSLGLEFNGRIVAVITFEAKNEPNNHEITSFCSIIDTCVVGGMSKLFKNFVKMKNPSKLIASVDRRYFNGFSLKFIDINYLKTTDIAFRHFHKVQRDFAMIEDSTVTEENGYLKIFDCGLLLYEWFK